MKREAILIKNTILYTFGTFSTKLLNFVMIPVYTSFLAVSKYGYLDLILSTVSLLVPLVTFQISDAVYRFLLGAESKIYKKKIFSNSFFVLVRNSIITILISIIFNSVIKIENISVIILYFISFIFFDFSNQATRAFRKNQVFALSSIVNSVISVILTFVFFRLKYGAMAPLIANSISMITTTILIWIYLKLFLLLDMRLVNKKIKKELVFYSIPLIPNLINWWIMNISDRYIISFYLGINANGIYAIANKISSILLVINSIFNLAWQETAITEYKSQDKDKFYTKIFNLLVLFQLTIFIGMLAISKTLFHWFIDEKYFEATYYLPFLYLAAIFSVFSSFYGMGFQSSRETKGAFYSSVYGSIANILINIVFVPIFGLQTVSVSTMVAFLLMWIIRIYQTKKYFIITINSKNLIFSSIIVISSIFFYYINQWYLTTFVLLVYTALIFITFRKLKGNLVKIKQYKH